MSTFYRHPLRQAKRCYVCPVTKNAELQNLYLYEFWGKENVAVSVAGVGATSALGTPAVKAGARLDADSVQLVSAAGSVTATGEDNSALDWAEAVVGGWVRRNNNERHHKPQEQEPEQVDVRVRVAGRAAYFYAGTVTAQGGARADVTGADFSTGAAAALVRGGSSVMALGADMIVDAQQIRQRRINQHIEFHGTNARRFVEVAEDQLAALMN